jgi:hypothetical protein
MFLVLTTLNIYAARAGRTLRPIRGAVIAALFAVNAVVSEVHQARPGSGRTGDPYDTLADLLGITVGAVAYLVVRRRPALTSLGARDVA